MGHTNIAASAIRNALAAQRAFAATGSIPRGAFAVRAQAGAADVQVAIAGAINAQKAQNEKLDSLASDVVDIQAAIDKMVIQMAGGLGQPAPKKDMEPGSAFASSGLSGSDISAHYRTNAWRAQAGGIAPQGNIGIADFIRGVAGMKCSDGVKAALSEGVGTDGGYSVPAIVMPSILDALVDTSALLTAGARIVPIGTGATSITTAAVDALPQPAWRLENSAIAESQPTFRAVKAVPKSISCIVPISRELLDDATDMNRAITLALSQAFAQEFDRAGLVGSGADPEPLGLYGMENVRKITQAGSAFAYSDLLAAYEEQLDSNAGAPTAAIMAPRTLIGLANLKDTLGQPLNAPAILNGVRRLSASKVPKTLGDSADKSLVFVGNFSTIQFYMREAFNVRLLPELYAKNGQLAFLAHARFDVVANYPQAMTVIEGVTS